MRVISLSTEMATTPLFYTFITSNEQLRHENDVTIYNISNLSSISTLTILLSKNNIMQPDKKPTLNRCKKMQTPAIIILTLCHDIVVSG